MGKQWKQRQTLFWGAPKSLQIPGLGRPSGEMKGYPLQYSGLEIHGVAKSWTGLSDFHFPINFIQNFVLLFFDLINALQNNVKNGSALFFLLLT